MAKNKKSRNQRQEFFNTQDPDNPIGNILGAAANNVADQCLQRLARETGRVFGVLPGPSAEDQVKLNMSRTALSRQEVELERVRARRDRENRLLDLQIAKKKADMDAARLHLEQMSRKSESVRVDTTVICGALEVPANPEGLFSSSEHSDAYEEWLRSLDGGKVILILGKRGSGKTALACKIGEYVMATRRMPICWIGLPDEARGLVPHWISLVRSLDRCPVGCLLIIDEAGLQYMSLDFGSDRNRALRALLMICRQRHCSLIFAVQSSRDVDNSVVRQADTIIFKEPGMHQAASERIDIRPMATKAAQAFEPLPQAERCQAAYVFDDAFKGMIKSRLPSFWSQDLSCVYSRVDVGPKQDSLPTTAWQMQTPGPVETKLLGAVSMDRDILALRSKGYGIEKIAKELGCSTWKVRKCLDGNQAREGQGW